jgi:DNA-binding MarR family transcriptional regulator
LKFMSASRDSAPDRLAIGQLLVRLLREFRDDLAEPRAGAGYGDVRETHFQIFGNVRMGGIRLTELAERAQLSLAAASELVNDLVDLGYLVRRPDPADGRAKLIDLTKRGRALMTDAGGRVVDIERRWSNIVGDRNFAQMTRTMQRLLDELDPKDSRA